MESIGTRPRSAPLETLPLHLFEYICQYVPRRSLFSLSLASSLCYQAATPRRFSQVKLTTYNKEKFRRDLNKLLAVLGRGNLFSHVRRVITIGRMVDNREQSHVPSTTSPVGTHDDGENDSDSDCDCDSDSWFQGSFNTPLLLSQQQKQAQQEAWLPFAQFLSQLPVLTDLVINCNQITPCVLAALHQYHPKSRLHIDGFSLPSLRQDRHQLHDIDPDDFALATSPCLYNLRARCRTYGEWGLVNFNLEALEHIVASGCAPGLRKVNIDHIGTSGTLALGRALRHPKERWGGFFLSTQNQAVINPQQQVLAPGRGRLETLVLSSNCGGLSHLQGWNARTDFGLLRRFEYRCNVSVESLRFLASMAASGSFRSLRKLRLAIIRDTTPGSDTRHLDQPAGSFLQALPPLEALTLEKYFGTHSVEAALSRHGPTLRKLRLLPYDGGKEHNDVDIDAARVREIQQRCPRLEDIELRVRRRQGGPKEVAVYRTLGRIPRLRCAMLLLDCRSPYRDPTHNRNVHRGTLMAYHEPEGDIERVRSTLMNLALDETLATEIFQKIISATPNCPLERLTLKPRVEDIISEQFSEIGEFGRWIGRSWALRRHATSGEVRVREIDVNQEEREYIRDNLEIVEYQDEDVWGTLWPNKGGDWKDDWHSFPLWREEDGAGGAGKEKPDVELHDTAVTPS